MVWNSPLSVNARTQAIGHKGVWLHIRPYTHNNFTCRQLKATMKHLILNYWYTIEQDHWALFLPIIKAIRQTNRKACEGLNLFRKAAGTQGKGIKCIRLNILAKFAPAYLCVNCLWYGLDTSRIFQGSIVPL